ncbi:unnamed protein product [Caenorhabditis sp. 36 PRJEB53466]|nr:unnamed protein product [Caenorhabditis sp. 36 PRJEB53466]
MERFREQIARSVGQLTEVFSSDRDVNIMLENMNDRIMSSYEAAQSPPTFEELPAPVAAVRTSSQSSTPRKAAKTKISDEDEVINAIDAAYFIDNDEFDAVDYELKKLCDVEMCYEDIQRERFRLKAQHTVVSKKISTLIMQKSSSYTAQVGEMEKIRDDVGGVVEEILTIRRSLKLATDQTRTCLGLIANEKKKNVLNELKNTLTAIKALHETEHTIRETIENGNFPLAIQMLIETQIRAAAYAHFTCINEEMSKLAGMSSLLETKLTSQLATIAVVFDPEKYRFVWTAYEMLEKTEVVAEKLLAAFTEAIETTTTAVLLDKLLDKKANEQEMKEAPYTSLCLKLDSDQVATTFREMGFVLCRSFHAFHKILAFHGLESASEASKNVYKSLLAARTDLFLTATGRFLTLVESRDFVSLKFDHILDIVDSINRFNNIGQAYFAFFQTKLADAIEKRTAIYFERYHKERVEELAMFIENESFTLCPVPIQFTIFDLQDFEFLKESRHDNIKGGEDTDENLEGTVDLIVTDWENPFCQAAIRSRHQSTYSQKSSDERSYSTTSAPELRKSQDSILEDPLDEPTGPPPPNLCNTALNLLRFFGRYIRMTALLPTLCAKSAPAIIDLYEFFFASICHLFGSEGAEFVERISRLAACLENISKKYSKEKGSNSPFRKVFRNGEGSSEQIYPSLCPAVQIAFIDNLYGACERIIAVDSVEFVARQLDLIRPVIESLLLEDVRESLHPVLEAFYAQVLPCHSDAKTLIVDASTSRALRLKSLVESVASVNWDIGELKSEHSPYVHLLAQDYELFSIRINSIKESEPINLTESMEKFFWSRAIHYSFKALVQGYGDGGKCSTEGRALMQLDFQMILLKLEPLCQMKPVPHASFVDGYIKAYYLPENGLEQWIKSHSEYSSKQLTSLLGAAAHVSKKARLRILDALKD